MNKKLQMTLALLATGTLALVVHAQDPGGPPPGGPAGPHGGSRRHPPLIIKALDANHDGMIDASEIANASEALQTLDKNGDGQLTPDEYMGPNAPTNVVASAHHRPLMPIIAALDANHDGIIDANEIANAPTSLKTLDKNGDGQLTPDELRPQRPPPPGNGREDGDGPPDGPPPGEDPGPGGPPPGPPPSDQ